MNHAGTKWLGWGGDACTGLGLMKLASFCREGPALELSAWGALWWL